MKGHAHIFIKSWTQDGDTHKSGSVQILYYSILLMCFRGCFLFFYLKKLFSCRIKVKIILNIFISKIRKQKWDEENFNKQKSFTINTKVAFSFVKIILMSHASSPSLHANHYKKIKIKKCYFVSFKSSGINLWVDVIYFKMM
jgi:hypothetical protein